MTAGKTTVGLQAAASARPGAVPSDGRLGSGPVPRSLLPSLGFTEGPLILGDGSLLVCDGTAGTLVRHDDGAATTFARLGGSPNGLTLAADGAVMVANVGSWRPEDPAPLPGCVQAVRDGEVAPVPALDDLAMPNDLAFGEDGRLYVTDSGGPDHLAPERPGAIVALAAAGRAETVLALGPCFPNGVGFDAEGSLLWTESTTRRLQRLEGGRVVTVHEFPEDHVPDGFAFARDGRIFVATLTSGGITVLAPDGERLGHLDAGAAPTNCAFDGEELIVTAVRDLDGAPGSGTVLALDVGVGGLPLHAGTVA